MRGITIAVVAAVLLGWAGPASAANLGSPAAWTQNSSARLIDLGPPTAPVLAATSSEGTGAAIDPGTKAILAAALSFFVGFGTGHFVLDDDASWMFLGIDAALVLGLVATQVVAFGAVAAGNIGLLMTAAVAIPVLAIVYFGVHIWQFVDGLYKSGLVGGGGAATAQRPGLITLPGSRDEGVASRLRPSAANGLRWQF